MTPNSTTNSPISQMISKLGSFLKPVEDPTKKLTYEAYSAPQNAAFDQWKNLNRSQFQYDTLDPWKRNYNNQAGSNNSYMMGNAKRLYKQANSGLERGYEDNLASARNMYDDMLRQGYNQRIQALGNSTNI